MDTIDRERGIPTQRTMDPDENIGDFNQANQGFGRSYRWTNKICLLNRNFELNFIIS